MEHRQPVVLLGAGASKKSGIPDARETVNRAAKWAWCKDHGRSILDLSVVNSDWQPWLESRPWFHNGVGLADQYPIAIDNLLGIADDRREFFEHLINPGVPPSEGYEALARIMGNGWVATVLTTNFDHCLHRAAILAGQPHHIVEIRTPSDWTRFSVSPSHPQLVYVHGSVEHYSDMNLPREVKTLNPNVVETLRPLLRDHPLVVVGYRGMEESINDRPVIWSMRIYEQFRSRRILVRPKAQRLPPTTATSGTVGRAHWIEFQSRTDRRFRAFV